MTTTIPCKIATNNEPDSKWKPPQTFEKRTKNVQRKHSYLNRIIECFEHTHTLGAELEVHGSFHCQGDSLVLDRILPRYDHHPREHFLGEGRQPPNTLARLFHPPGLLAKSASVTINLFKDADTHWVLITDQMPGCQDGEGPALGGPGGAGARNLIPSPPSRHTFVPAGESKQMSDFKRAKRRAWGNGRFTDHYTGACMMISSEGIWHNKTLFFRFFLNFAD